MSWYSHDHLRIAALRPTLDLGPAITLPTRSAYDTDVAMSATGRGLVVWNDERSSGNDLKMTTFAPPQP